jgi:hypothetical protein
VVRHIPVRLPVETLIPRFEPDSSSPTTQRNPLQLGVLGLLITVAGLALGSPVHDPYINPVPFMAFLSLAPGITMVVAALAWSLWGFLRRSKDTSKLI